MYFTAEDEIYDVYAEVYPMAGDWDQIAVGLKIPPAVKSCIAEENPSKPKMCLLAVLHEWLKKVYNVHKYGLPSWRSLVKAVASPLGGANPALAEAIAKEHPGMQ